MMQPGQAPLVMDDLYQYTLRSYMIAAASGHLLALRNHDGPWRDGDRLQRYSGILSEVEGLFELRRVLYTNKFQ
jgi:hypothetical protein